LNKFPLSFKRLSTKMVCFIKRTIKRTTTTIV